MKNSNIQVRAAVLLVALALFASYSFSKDKPKDSSSVVLHGAVMDSQCAFNVHSDAHSHEWMTKRQPAAGEHGILAAFGPGLTAEMLLLEWS